MPKPKIIGMPWDFSSLFNEAIRTLPERPMVKRDYLWASELQMDAYSRYLRMWAHPMSNPINDRSRRKFIMGHLVEWTVGLMLTLTGILKSKQMRGEVQLPGLLKVTGKLDFVAGGNIDWVKAREEVRRIQMLFAVSFDDMPPIIRHAIDYVFTKMEIMFAFSPLREYILECKSASGLIMKLIQKSNKPRRRHVLQPFHYLLANKDIPEAQLLYISKDDAIMETFPVTRTKELMKVYTDDVKMMTDYYNNSGRNYMKNLPPKEPEMLFEEDSFTFQKNMNVQYSNYLTMGWGYKDYDAFEERWAKVKSSWNRTFKRHVLEGTTVERTVNGKTTSSVMKLTAANIEIIKEASKLFPEWDKYVQLARKSGAFQKPEENEDDV